MDNPVTQASLSAERFDLRHPCPTQGREYGDLAANISPTNENPFTNAPVKIYLVLRYDKVTFLHSKDTVVYNKLQ